MWSEPVFLDRVRGSFLGLAAGDRNGGPMRMAIRLSESLLDKKGLEVADVAHRYNLWRLGPPHDIEKAFDTGPTFSSVFGAYNNGGVDSMIAKAVSVDSLGVNSAHRCIGIACSSFFKTDEDLVLAGATESKLTHAHPIAVQTACAFLLLCRRLMEGFPLKEAAKAAKKHITNPQFQVLRALSDYDELRLNELDRGGIAALTLSAALYFVYHGTDFESCLLPSLEFAGSPNYCPVLVGALAGAIYGAAGIPERHLQHEMVIGAHGAKDVTERLHRVAQDLANTWQQ